MITSINGQPAEWAAEIQAKWDAFVASCAKSFVVSRCNYFTPRPYVDQYNRGDSKEGFVYIVDRQVAMHVIAGGVPWLVNESRRMAMGKS